MTNVSTGNGRRTGWGARALLAAGLVAGALLPATPAAAVHGAVPGDFNGDGYRDAVLPAPGATVAGKTDAGAVVVLYGAKSGLSTTDVSRRKTITQNSAGVPSTAEKDDEFGAATATADLNHDGYADLVIGAPYEDTAAGTDAGMVTVMWGGKYGLLGSSELPSPSDEPEYFGLDLAAVTGSTKTKASVMVAGWDGAVGFSGPFSRSGGYGSVGLNQDTGSVASVTLGYFSGTTNADGAHVTVGLSDLSGGAVYSGKQLQGNGRIAAAGDVNGDGYDDLVVGDPEDAEVTGVDGALGGRVLVYHGSAAGITPDTVPAQITQNTAGVPDTSEKGDDFGGSVAVADLNGDGLDEIVVGTPREGIGGARRTGRVTVIPGRASGALGTGAYSYSQYTAGVPGADESDDYFGTTVSAGDINGDGKPELLVSGVGEDNMTGAVWVFPGSASGPKAAGTHMITASAVNLKQGGGTYLGGMGLFWVI